MARVRGGARAERGGVSERRDDLTLMELVARRDATALDALYLRHSPLVFALCLRVLRNHAEAEEVLQEVFWELWRSSGRYAAERGSARVYLVQLARSRSHCPACGATKISTRRCCALRPSCLSVV